MVVDLVYECSIIGCREDIVSVNVDTVRILNDDMRYSHIIVKGNCQYMSRDIRRDGFGTISVAVLDSTMDRWNINSIFVLFRFYNIHCCKKDQYADNNLFHICWFSLIIYLNNRKISDFCYFVKKNSYHKKSSSKYIIISILINFFI